MSITRRQFLLSIPAVAAGFILPSFLLRATEYLEKTGKPLLVAPAEFKSILTAHDYGGDEYVLSFGHPYQEPPVLTLREYLEQYYWGDDADYREENEIEEDDFNDALDEVIDVWLYQDTWLLQESPQRIAYDYLSCLELGPELENDNAVGGIEFINGPCPGSDYTAVHVPDDLSLSLLQERLNQLNEEVKIEIYDE